MKIFYSTPLFNGLQISRFDPFFSEVTRFDRANITISLQSYLPRENRRFHASQRTGNLAIRHQNQAVLWCSQSIQIAEKLDEERVFGC